MLETAYGPAADLPASSQRLAGRWDEVVVEGRRRPVTLSSVRTNQVLHHLIRLCG